MSEFEIKSINPRQMSAEEIGVLNVFSNQMRAERLPDDPPTTLADEIMRIRTIPPFVDVSGWVAIHNQQIVAFANCVFLRMEQNQHLAQFNVDVLPAYRQQGLGRRLTALFIPEIKRENRRLMVTETSDRVPAGGAFMQKLGGEMALGMRVNQLKLSELNYELMNSWLARAPERAAGFSLGMWIGAYPAEDLPAIADLMNVMNDAPRDNLDIEDFKFTPEQIKQMEEGLVKRGVEHWTLYVREQASGELAGFTDVMWNPHKPELISQNSTGVWPKYRSKGLGRWLKAAMLEKILREKPQVKYIRTGNAHSNAPMLKINEELGFKPYMTSYSWQVATEKVEAYLASRGV